MLLTTQYLQYLNTIITSSKCTFVGLDMYFDAVLTVVFICGIDVCAQWPITPKYVLYGEWYSSISRASDSVFVYMYKLSIA